MKTNDRHERPSSVALVQIRHGVVEVMICPGGSSSLTIRVTDDESLRLAALLIDDRAA